MTFSNPSRSVYFATIISRPEIMKYNPVSGFRELDTFD